MVHYDSQITILYEPHQPLRLDNVQRLGRRDFSNLSSWLLYILGNPWMKNMNKTESNPRLYPNPQKV